MPRAEIPENKPSPVAGEEDVVGAEKTKAEAAAEAEVDAANAADAAELANDPAPEVPRRSGVAPASAATTTSSQSYVPPPPPSILHPRGRIWPLLPRTTPLWRRFVRGTVRLIQGLYHHEDIFQMAPAMAFHFFLSLLPLLVFVGYLLGLVAEHKGASSVLWMLLDNLPATTETILKKEVGGLTSATRLGPLAAIGFFWIASGGTQGLMQAIERVVGVPPRVWWRQRLLALAWVLGTLVAFAIVSFSIIQWDDVVHPPDEVLADATTASSSPNATTTSTSSPSPTTTPGSPSTTITTPPQPVMEGGPEQDDGRGGSHWAAKPKVAMRSEPARRARKFLRDGGERVLAISLSLVAAVGGLATFYHFAIAHRRRVRRRVLPGALLAIALVIIISWGFSLYVRTLDSYTVYYGSLAAIAVLLVWLWLMSIAILVGAELNSQLEGLRDLPRPRGPNDSQHDEQHD